MKQLPNELLSYLWLSYPQPQKFLNGQKFKTQAFLRVHFLLLNQTIKDLNFQKLLEFRPNVLFNFYSRTNQTLTSNTIGPHSIFDHMLQAIAAWVHPEYSIPSTSVEFHPVYPLACVVYIHM